MPICLDGLIDEYTRRAKLEIQMMLDSAHSTAHHRREWQLHGQYADICSLPSGESPGQLECGKCWAVRAKELLVQCVVRRPSPGRSEDQQAPASSLILVMKRPPTKGW
eukprot:s2639_g12.t1